MEGLMIYALVLVGYAYTSPPNFDARQPIGPQMITDVSAIDSSMRFKSSGECESALKVLSWARGL
jgi:hypothetical protein